MIDVGPNRALVFRSSVRGRRTEIETADEIARAIERAEAVLGSGRVRYVHPDCGFWMLKRPIVDAKIRALVMGRDLYEGRNAARVA